MENKGKWQERNAQTTSVTSAERFIGNTPATSPAVFSMNQQVIIERAIALLQQPLDAFRDAHDPDELTWKEQGELNHVTAAALEIIERLQR